MSETQRRSRAVNPLSPLRSKDQKWGVSAFLASLDSPRALTVEILWRYGEHSQILGLPMPDGESSTFHQDYLATRLLSKSVFLNTGIDTAAAAMESFWASEKRCFQTNRKLRDAQQRPHSGNAAVNALLQLVQRKIADILGPFPGAEYFETHGLGWSKGATSSCKGRNVSQPHKYQARLDTTPGAAATVLRAVQFHDLWGYAITGETRCPSEASTIRGNKLQLVPKSAKTDRVICVEPHGNVWLQRSVGRYIRRKLRSRGVNLDDQTINQERARVGSLTGAYATLDLKAASDTISYELVKQVLPEDWFDYLNSLRSPFTFVEGKWLRLEKFSSMGNGYTFELESLLFYAVCSCFTKDVTVYGDDIVVDSTSAEVVILGLEECGFEINTSKSFSTGHFRESCGGDYLRGVRVSPVYLRSLNLVCDWINFHNRIRDRAPYPKPMSLLEEMRSRVPGFLGCAGYGDYHYHVNFDEARPSKDLRGWEGYVFKTFLAIPSSRSLDGINLYAALATALGPGNSNELRDALTGLRNLLQLTAKQSAQRSRSVERQDVVRGAYRLVPGHVRATTWSDVIRGIDF